MFAQATSCTAPAEHPPARVLDTIPPTQVAARVGKGNYGQARSTESTAELSAHQQQVWSSCQSLMVMSVQASSPAPSAWITLLVFPILKHAPCARAGAVRIGHADTAGARCTVLLLRPATSLRRRSCLSIDCWWRSACHEQKHEGQRYMLRRTMRQPVVLHTSGRGYP